MSSQPLDALLADRATAKTEGTPLAGADRAMVERWADFTKALAMYPETNSRVQESRNQFLEALAGALRGDDRSRPSAAIKLERDEIIVDGTRGPITHGTNLYWMYERLDKAALEGVRIHADVQPDQLIAFAKRLLKNFARKNLRVTPQDLWPETYEGLELVLRKFEGGFHGGGSGTPTDIFARRDEAPTESEVIGADSGMTGSSEEPEGGAEEAAFERELSKRLAGEERVVSRIQSLRGAVEMSRKDEGDTVHVDLVSGIVRMLPVDVAADFNRVVDLTESVLEALNEHVAHEGLSIEPGPDGGMADLKALLFAASRKYFGRAKSDAGKQISREQRGDGSDLHKTAKQGHKGDEKIVDDLDAFLAELAHLPMPGNKAMTAEQADLGAEQLDVYLTFLTDVQSVEVVRNLHPPLRELLKQPNAGELKVLQTHLEREWFRTGAGDGRVGKTRILGLLQQAQATRLLRRCGFLSKEHVVEAFPQNFGHYVDALDFSNREDMAEFESVCRTVGEARIHESADALIRDAALLDGARAEKLLSHASFHLMPFAKILIDRGGDRFRDLVINFLQAVKPRKREACLLTIVENPIFLSSRYLSLITSPVLSEEDERKLKHEVAEVLCRFIRAAVHVSGQSERRLEAVRHLAFFPTSQTAIMLQELQKARRLWFFKAESAEIRTAARLGLLTIETEKGRV